MVITRSWMNSMARADRYRREQRLAMKLGKKPVPYAEWKDAGEEGSEPFWRDDDGRRVRSLEMRVVFPSDRLQRLYAASRQVGTDWTEIVNEATDMWLERYDAIRSAALADDLLREEEAVRWASPLTTHEGHKGDWVGVYQWLRVAGSLDRYVRVSSWEEVMDRELEKTIARGGRVAAMPRGYTPDPRLWPVEYRFRSGAKQRMRIRRMQMTCRDWARKASKKAEGGAGP